MLEAMGAALYIVTSTFLQPGIFLKKGNTQTRGGRLIENTGHYIKNRANVQHQHQSIEFTITQQHHEGIHFNRILLGTFSAIYSSHF